MPRNKRSNSYLPGVLLLACTAAAMFPLAGCQPPRPALFDADALTAARRLIVLPLVDAPGPEGKGSGRVVSGAIIADLLRMGRFDIVNIPRKKLMSALEKTGYALQDCYDPVVAAAVGKELNADAVVCGELTHYGTEKEHSTTYIMIAGGGQTDTRHWASLNLRIVSPADGSIIYNGTGNASSKEGYTSAIRSAVRQATGSLGHFLRQQGK